MRKMLRLVCGTFIPLAHEKWMEWSGCRKGEHAVVVLSCNAKIFKPRRDSFAIWSIEAEIDRAIASLHFCHVLRSEFVCSMRSCDEFNLRAIREFDVRI